MPVTKEKLKYYEAVGRRKMAIARVRLSKSTKTTYTINDKSIEEYFQVAEHRLTVKSALTSLETPEHFSVSIRVGGGGVAAQAEAIRHGIARALLVFSPPLRKGLKNKKFLTRDPRIKERRKFGLKKARKAPQWSKR